MGETIKKRTPKYLKAFKCIAGKCEDSCCIGWDINIDKTTFRQYHKVQDKDMKRMFQKNVHNNSHYLDSRIDYGKVKLTNDKRCPFLDDENYCIIYSKLGEAYLSNVCASFPRIINKVDGWYEMSLDVACPEAARIILLQENGIEFEEGKEALEKYVLSSEIDTKSKEFSHSLVRYFKEIRDMSIKIIQNRKLEISQRLYVLGEFLTSLENESKTSFSTVPKLIKSYDMDSVKHAYGKNKDSFLLQMDFFKKMLGFLNISKEVDSLSFKKLTEQIMAEYKFEEEDYRKHPEIYRNAYENYTVNVINSNSMIFENYLVNFIYNNMFPFSETDSLFDGYMMLLTRYSFIRFYLIGKYLYNGNDSKESIVEFIQIFSKSIGHHKTYSVDVLNFLKENNFNNLEFAKILLPEW
jgi:lysine-N-methylase